MGNWQLPQLHYCHDCSVVVDERIPGGKMSYRNRNLPRMSYALLVPALMGFTAGAWCVAAYWMDGPWDANTDKGNIMFHDPVNFLFAIALFAISGICIAMFLSYHGPFGAGRGQSGD